MSVVCCQVEVCATGWSLAQESHIECDVSECDREVSTMRRPMPARAVEPLEEEEEEEEDIISTIINFQ